MSRICLISPVRKTTREIEEQVGKYVEELESLGHTVYWPRRDNPYQEVDKNGITICDANKLAMQSSDEVHLWYHPESQFSLFDVGMAFMVGKRFRIVNPDELPPTEDKSLNNFLRQYAIICGQKFDGEQT